MIEHSIKILLLLLALVLLSWMCGDGRGRKKEMSRVRDDLQNSVDASRCSTGKVLDRWKIEDERWKMPKIHSSQNDGKEV